MWEFVKMVLGGMLRRVTTTPSDALIASYAQLLAESDKRHSDRVAVLEARVAACEAKWEAREKDFRDLRDANARLLSENTLLKDGKLVSLITVDNHAKILSWCSDAQQMFGYSSAAIVGKSLALLVPFNYRQKHRNGFLEVLNDPSKLPAGKRKVLGLHENGKEFEVIIELSTWPPEQDSGTLFGIKATYPQDD